MESHADYDAVVIGGGFFGTTLSVELAGRVRKVLLVEREDDLLQRASYANQARVHNGYHYPRSVLTAYRSHVNFERFIREYESAIDSSFTQIYAIGRIYSKVSAAQFHQFCVRIGAPIAPASKAIMRIFNPDLIEAAFEVREFAFNAERLKQHVSASMKRAGVTSMLGTEAIRVERESDAGGGLCVLLQDRASGGRGAIRARHVFWCGYSRINRLLRDSGLPLISFKHELAEIALIEAPPELRGRGVTVMDGPFFGTMPFPARGVHSFYHVRYAPHYYWHEGPGVTGMPSPPVLAEADRQVEHKSRRSRFTHMIHDAARYLPTLNGARWVESLWELRTVLPRSENDDSRPILFSQHHGLKNLFCVAGGKLDNVYDLVDELNKTDLA